MEAEEQIDELKEENESKMQILFKNLEKAESKIISYNDEN